MPMAMAPIEEENDKDLEKGPAPAMINNTLPAPSPIRATHAATPPSPMTPRRIMSNSGRTLALSSSGKKVSTPLSVRKSVMFASHSSKSFSSFQELGSGGGSFSPSMEISPPSSPFTLNEAACKTLGSSNSCKQFTSSHSSKLLLSNSGKRMDQRKMYVKQVTGKHKDTELHLVAKRGDVEAVRQILAEIDAQMTGTLSGAEFDEDLAEIRIAIVNEANELGETALFTAAEKGYLGVVQDLLPYMTQEGLSLKNRSGLDALHAAAAQGHQVIVQVLLDHDPGLCNTFGPSHTTPLISAAVRGHLGVVNELLAKDPSLLEISKTNGKNALHLTARLGYATIVQVLLDKDPHIARRTDKKRQTALHMAAKGQSSEVVRLLLAADPAIVMLPDRFGNTALHVAARKKRLAIVNELLLVPETNVNALTREHKTPFDIAEGLPPSDETSDIKDILMRYGAVRANELNQPRDELRQTVTEIQKNVHSQLEQARRTNKNVDGIAKELKRLHREGINNATNSVTVVAVLFATVAFAAIFTVPGGDYNDGTAVMASHASFQIFFIFNAIALFTSLAVVVVQMTLVRGETKSERKVVVVINKLMWLASICTTVAFISSAYIVVGRHHKWAALFITVLGATVMTGVLGTMTFFVVKYRRIRKKVKKADKSSRTAATIDIEQEADLSDLDVKSIYAL